MKKFTFTIVFALAVNLMLAQTYNMKIKQGTGTTNSVTSTVDEITFVNTTTTPFVCGDVILYGGETYPTILIGSQCWFQKNLNIGTRIDGGSDQTSGNGIEKYCYGDNNANCVTYGGLYQWAEAVQYQNGATNTTSPSPAFTGNVQGICPPGWHIPTYEELQALAVGNNGITLKAVGQGSGIGAGTNTSGFSALLAGYRISTGSFGDLASLGSFWSSTESNATVAHTIYLNATSGSIYPTTYNKRGGFSVRCLKD
jgi:uncharacterized protein (TIGR02145 family)